jgi:hypothetical protein
VGNVARRKLAEQAAIQAARKLKKDAKNEAAERFLKEAPLEMSVKNARRVREALQNKLVQEVDNLIRQFGNQNKDVLLRMASERGGRWLKTAARTREGREAYFELAKSIQKAFWKPQQGLFEEVLDRIIRGMAAGL